MLQKSLICVLLLCLLQGIQASAETPAVTQQPAADKDIMAVKLWGGKSGRSPYEYDLLHAVLEHTADTDPPYQLHNNAEKLGALRGREMVANGEHLNVYVSGLRHDQLTESGRLLMVKHPTMKGLLGYRSLIIRKQDYPAFKQLRTLEQLRQWTIGQGSNWEDAHTLRHNQLNIDDSGFYENLLTMLHHKRFDAVLLGVMEAPAALATSPLHAQLMIVPEVIVYYPHAMVFHVSGKYPELADRLARGLTMVESNGTLDHLLDKHFGETLARMRKQNPHVIVLQHPHPEYLPSLISPLLLSAHFAF